LVVERNDAMAQDGTINGNGRHRKQNGVASIPKNDPRRKLLPASRLETEAVPQNAPALSPLRARRLARNLLHLFIYTIIQTLFSLYMRVRRAYHAVSYAASAALFYHHRSPEYIERDVAALKKRPHHLSVVLTLSDETRLGPELERLVDEAADLAAWSASAGIPVLSVYERTGILKKYLPQVHQHILQKFTTYFGRAHPGLTITAPDQDSIETLGPLQRNGDGSGHDDESPFVPHMQVIFVSGCDGREALVDLTRTFAEMRQHGKIKPGQIQPEVIDTELIEGIFPEPDLLVVFTPHDAPARADVRE
jgi:dehydrodolichyl diphosphate syntase complex subunit NUS1